LLLRPFDQVTIDRRDELQACWGAAPSQSADRKPDQASAFFRTRLHRALGGKAKGKGCKRAV
jgi:hypothetical protein